MVAVTAAAFGFTTEIVPVRAKPMSTGAPRLAVIV